MMGSPCKICGEYPCGCGVEFRNHPLVLHTIKFLEGARNGMREYVKTGKARPWEEIRKELGIKEAE